MEMTVIECCDAIEKLKKTLYGCSDNPVKSPEFLAIQSAIIELCNKLKQATIKLKWIWNKKRIKLKQVSVQTI